MTVPLTEGEDTAIVTEVTAQDGFTKTSYTSTVSRAPSTDVVLGALAFNDGDHAAQGMGEVTPAVAEGVTSYSITAPNALSSVSIVATPQHASASVAYSSDASHDGGTVTLAEGGDTVVSIVVTAQDGTTTQAYTVTIARAPSTVATLSSVGVKVGTALVAVSPVMDDD